MLLARPVPIAIGACLALLACRPQVDRIERASQRARPHIASYRSFERWAERAVAAPNAPRAADALGEIVFAPIRNAPGVIGAWVEIAGDRALTLALPASSALPSEASWVALRDPSVGALRVADAERCPTAQPARPSAADSTCVLISRAAGAGRERTLTVTMAFVADAAGRP